MSLRLKGVAALISSGLSSLAKVLPLPARASPILLTAYLFKEQEEVTTTNRRKKGSNNLESWISFLVLPISGSPLNNMGLPGVPLSRIRCGQKVNLSNWECGGFIVIVYLI